MQSEGTKIRGRRRLAIFPALGSALSFSRMGSIAKVAHGQGVAMSASWLCVRRGAEFWPFLLVSGVSVASSGANGDLLCNQTQHALKVSPIHRVVQRCRRIDVPRTQPLSPRSRLAITTAVPSLFRRRIAPPWTTSTPSTMSDAPRI